jgi:hypothetical protein
MITTALRASVSIIGPSLGITSCDISARALRAGGCMALIRGGVDPLQARLMGRWESWCMIEYLLVDALDTSPFAAKMLIGGEYEIPRHQTLPADVQRMWESHQRDLVAASA